MRNSRIYGTPSRSVNRLTAETTTELENCARGRETSQPQGRNKFQRGHTLKITAGRKEKNYLVACNYRGCKSIGKELREIYDGHQKELTIVTGSYLNCSLLIKHASAQLDFLEARNTVPTESRF